MQKILVSIPDDLSMRMRAVFPSRMRSQIIAALIDEEVKKREEELYRCAVDVEKDEGLHAEMVEWNITSKDGLDDESW
ncbi:MAG: hypothetical protein K2Q33_09035 [Gammaproteobacteria bacterium]|jgi:hypothetical protein|uniref:hypothetical protein n=1 Tax=Silvanigrella sp. TaxID=2024976 RepID=UPI001D333C4A|nr:hypothetical protein [Gammaproteobacteria bacterium]